MGTVTSAVHFWLLAAYTQGTRVQVTSGIGHRVVQLLVDISGWYVTNVKNSSTVVVQLAKVLYAPEAFLPKPNLRQLTYDLASTNHAYSTFKNTAILSTGGVLLYLPHHLDLASEDSVGHSTCMSVLARRRAIMGSIVQPKRSCLGLSRNCHVLVTVHAGASQGYVLGIPLYPTGRSST